MNIHIVTDSHAYFSHPQLIGQYPVTVIPNRMVIAGQTYREGVDLSAEEALEMIQHQMTPPKVIPPSVDEYVTLYTQLAHHYDGVISIHASRALSKSWQNARDAAKQLEGHVQIAVIDSRTLDAGQGLIVRAAMRAVKDNPPDFNTLVQQIRGATERVYSVYYVESPVYLMRNKIMTVSHAVMSAMHNVMPLITVEDGQLVTMEKVRTRTQAIDRLIEFVIEFEQIEDALIVQHRNYIGEQTRMLQDRLALEFKELHFPYSVYSPSLAALIGADASGLVILEKEWDDVIPYDNNDDDDKDCDI